ncbi:imidazole glycerol phosphate synthase subunit HisH [Alphaproteobacteria bacterium]|nr:imidazole glycerol phosphate synthase subunit HisH [Alphaproteobacteria bacterium]
MKRNVGIIDLGSGNVGAIANRLSELSVEYCLINAPTKTNLSHIILPGVGNFDTFMDKMRRCGLFEFIIEKSSKNTKILGVCVGMHALANDSEEGESKGLGLIPGSVKKIKTNLPTPHMGWNSIYIETYSPIVEKLNLDIGFYYLHNYKFVPKCGSEVIAYSNYGETVTGIIKKDNIFGVQFHPEKSHKNGLLLFKNFLEL